LLKKSVWNGVIGALLGLAFGYFIIAGGTGGTRARWDVLLPAIVLGLAIMVPLITLALAVAVTFHELGHVLAGRLAGFRFLSMAVGPIEVRRQEDGLRWHRMRPARAGGFVTMVPTKTDQLETRMLLFILGGPVASLLFSAFTYWAYVATDPERGAGLLAGIPHMIALSMLVMGLALLPGTLLPYTASTGNPTDMKVALMILGRPEGRERLVALMLLARELNSGIRAREWSRELLERAAAVRDNTEQELRSLLLLHYHLLDDHEVEEARRVLARAIAVLPTVKHPGEVLRECLRLEAAYDAAWRDNDLERAARELEASNPASEALSGTRARVDAAIAVRRGDYGLAQQRLNDAVAQLAVAQRRYGGNNQLDLDLVQDVRTAMP